MRNRIITVDTSIEVDVATVIDALEYDDLCECIKGLSAEEKADFAEFLPECFDGVSVSDLLGLELVLEEALDVITHAYQVSPYDRDKIKDRLNEAKIV